MLVALAELVSLDDLDEVVVSIRSPNPVLVVVLVPLEDSSTGLESRVLNRQIYGF